MTAPIEHVDTVPHAELLHECTETPLERPAPDETEPGSGEHSSCLRERGDERLDSFLGGEPARVEEDWVGGGAAQRRLAGGSSRERCPLGRDAGVCPADG